MANEKTYRRIMAMAKTISASVTSISRKHGGISIINEKSNGMA